MSSPAGRADPAPTPRLTVLDGEPKVSRHFEHSNNVADPDPVKRSDAVRKPELEVADSIGRLMEFWGFKRPMGRIWALLYLTPEPIGASEIRDELRMSAGAVSMALSELVRWGAVKKTWRPGKRRDFYEAETGIGHLIQRVIRARELALVREFAESVRAAEQQLADSPTVAGSIQSFQRARLRELESIAKLGEGLLTALVSGTTIDPTPLLKTVERR